MSYGNDNFERMAKPAKRAKPPADFEQSKDAQRVRERSKQAWQRNDKRQQWQDTGVEF